MWAIAGILLGAFVLLSILGFHLGPHSHLGGAGFGLLAAAWLALIAVSSRSAPFVWALFATDLFLTAAVGGVAWRALEVARRPSVARPSRVIGSEGVARTALDPDGTVVVNGETWSAISLNGDLPAGSAVQVVGLRGIHLEVWGEDVHGLLKGVGQ